jgi:Beta-lactamase
MSLVSSNIDSLFSAFSGDSPGCAIGVVRDGEPILSIGYGMADLEHGVPFTPASVSYLASVSKQFTALTTLLLVDDRKLALDECVKSIIPELPDCASGINIRHPLTHTSGLRPYGILGYLSGLHSEHPYSEDDIIRFVSRHESLDFVPGKEFMYSNTGYVLLSDGSDARRSREREDIRPARDEGLTVSTRSLGLDCKQGARVRETRRRTAHVQLHARCRRTATEACIPQWRTCCSG